jgi:5-methylcytosine-specific restriction protein A
LIPFAELVKRPDKVVLDPKTDFTVVCANCHRMLHRGSPPPSAVGLKALLKQSGAPL